MACACAKRQRVRFVWTDPEDATKTVTYTTEPAAIAKVARKGGEYKKVAV